MLYTTESLTCYQWKPSLSVVWNYFSFLLSFNNFAFSIYLEISIDYIEVKKFRRNSNIQKNEVPHSVQKILPIYFVII